MGQVEYQPPMKLPNKPEVSYSPLGGKVGISDEARAEAELAARISDEMMGTQIENTYAEAPGDGHVLNHIRRRNLGLI